MMQNDFKYWQKEISEVILSDSNYDIFSNCLNSKNYIEFESKQYSDSVVSNDDKLIEENIVDGLENNSPKNLSRDMSLIRMKDRSKYLHIKKRLDFAKSSNNSFSFLDKINSFLQK